MTVAGFSPLSKCSWCRRAPVVLAALFVVVPPRAVAQVSASPPAPGQASVAGSTGPPGARTYPGTSLTLRQAVEEALSANPQLGLARAARKATETRPDTERYLMPPMLEAQVFQWPLDKASPADAQFMFTIQQDFPGRGKRALRVARAEQEVALAANVIDMRAVGVAADTKQAYVEVWASRQRLELLDDAVRLVRQLGEAAQVKYAAGRITQLDVVKALLERTKLEQEILMVSEQARMAETRLNGVLARAPGTPVGPLAPPDPVPLPSAESLQALARAHQPELRGPTLEAKVAEADLAVIQGERKPDFVVQGGYMVMPYMTNAVTGRVGITWPTAPWVRKKFDAQRREAEARRDVAQATARALENQVGQMVQEALVRAQSAESRAVLIRSALLPQAEHGLELARLAYQTDRGSFLDVIDTARGIVNLRLDLVQAESDRQLAVVALERAAGTDLLPGSAASQGDVR